MNHRYRLFYATYKALLILAHEIESEKRESFDPVNKARQALLKVFIESASLSDTEMLMDLERINLAITGVSIIPKEMIESK
jgi:hypothetical protein